MSAALFSRLILALIILLLPTQLNHFFWPSFSYVFGLPIDYLAPALYLQDILIVIFIISNPPHLKLKPWFLIPLALIVTNVLISQHPVLSLQLWLRLLLLYLFYRSVLSSNHRLPLLPLLLASTIIPSLLALSQFLRGGSLQGIFYFLGERSLDLATPGISKTFLCLPTLGCHFYLRPYSTFSHPNILAAYLGLIWLAILSLRSTLSRLTLRLFYFLTPIILLTILLTFSRSAIIALLAALVLPRFLPKTLSPLKVTILYLAANLIYWLIPYLPLLRSSIPNINSLSLIERLSFNQIYLQIFTRNPLLGVGLGHSIVSLSKEPIFWSTFTHRLFLQPPHNTSLLLLVELGVLPLLYLASKFISPPKGSLPIFSKIFPRFSKSFSHVSHQVFTQAGHSPTSSVIIFLFLTSLFDHYYVTAFQLRLLLVFLLLLYNKR